MLAVSEIRKDLMRLTRLIESPSSEAEGLVLSLRQRVRVLALLFEERSGANPPRPEVLQTFEPLPVPDGPLEWAADSRGARFFSKSWREHLHETQRSMSRGAARVD
jgi:hypothetical protein